MRFQDCSPRLVGELIINIDFACQSCFWRRRFLRFWQDVGIDVALADFEAGAPRVNEVSFKKVRETVERIHDSYR